MHRLYRSTHVNLKFKESDFYLSAKGSCFDNIKPKYIVIIIYCI